MIDKQEISETESIVSDPQTETIISDPLVLKLSVPFTFEEKEYSEINLRKLNSWTCGDVVKVTKEYKRMTGGADSPMDAILPEVNLEYVEFVAARASGLPIEFFKNLPARESGKLRAAVIAFFHPAD